MADRNPKLFPEFEALLFSTPTQDPEIKTLALSLVEAKNEPCFVGCLQQLYSLDIALMEHGTPGEIMLAVVAKLRVIAQETEVFARKFEKKARNLIAVAGALNPKS